MNEPLFGSSAPMWTAAPSAGIGYQVPLGAGSPLSPALFGGSTAGPAGPTVVNALGGTAGTQSMPPPVTPSYTYAAGFSQTLAPSDSSAVMVGLRANAVTGMVSAPSLLTAVAMRRGQPLGPTNDQEIEDFIYDALDLLPGTSEVDVRCESGRAMLSGTVQQKRAKRDIGEIAWAIPAVQDVQNNVTIAARRRTRATAAAREAETPVTSGRK
jgi:BON domain